MSDAVLADEPGLQPDHQTPPVDPQQIADITAAFFLQATDDALLTDRIRTADTTVHIHLTDTAGVTLRLDRDPIEAEPRISGHAEIELWTSAQELLRCGRGERQLAMSIMRGQAEYSGPVRKFLRIQPILRSFDLSVWSYRSMR